jgi:hypothetical protein
MQQAAVVYNTAGAHMQETHNKLLLPCTKHSQLRMLHLTCPSTLPSTLASGAASSCVYMILKGLKCSTAT